jgi:hypothetical protein
MPYFSQFEGSDYPRLSQRSTGNSALYTVLTDVTKPMLQPLNMNDLIDGTGNGAFTMRTAIPAGARAFIPVYMSNIAVGATTARISSVGLTFTHASATVCYLMFVGRMKTKSGIYANDPFAAAMTSAVNPATYGYWKMLGRIHYTASAGGTARVIAHEDFLGQNPTSTAIGVWGGTGNLNRTLISHMVSGALGSVVDNAQTAAGSMQVSTTPSVFNAIEHGMLPTHGCEEIMAFTTFSSSTAGTIASSVAMATGTGTVGSIGVGVSFYS